MRIDPAAMSLPPRSSPEPLAPYRCLPEQGRDRFVPEAASATRSAYQRDRDRIIHSTAFRRLALKTQVFLPDEGDHYRTRLTHTIEVAQITRTLTRALGLDDDLGEALALAHDFGHTPFGHTGEEALHDAMLAFGGFDHNAQTLRVVTLLERRYPRFPGLNLTWDTLEGLFKRGRRALDSGARARWFRSDVPCLADTNWSESFDATPYASGEAQAAALADDIAYNAHDLEDGLQAGLFGLVDLDAVPLLRRTRDGLRNADPGLDDDLVIRGLARELVGTFVVDAITESRRRLNEAAPLSAADVRRAEHALIALSEPFTCASEAIKDFLSAHMYRHPRLLDMRARSKRVVQDLAERYLTVPDLLPPHWRDPAEPDRPPSHHARRVTDYLASMTDRFAIAEHRRFFDAPFDLR